MSADYGAKGVTVCNSCAAEGPAFCAILAHIDTP